MGYRSSDAESVRADMGSPRMTAMMAGRRSVIQDVCAMEPMAPVSPWESLGGLFGLILSCLPRGDSDSERGQPQRRRWKRSSLVAMDWAIRAAAGMAICASLSTNEDTKDWFFLPVLVPVVAVVAINSTMAGTIANAVDSIIATVISAVAAFGIQLVADAIDEAKGAKSADIFRFFALFVVVWLTQVFVLRRPLQTKLFVAFGTVGVLSFVTQRDMDAIEVMSLIVDVAVPALVGVAVSVLPAPRLALIDAKHNVRAATKNILHALNSVSLAFCAVDVTTSRIHTLRADTCLSQALDQLLFASDLLKLSHTARRFRLNRPEMRRLKKLTEKLRCLRMHLESMSLARSDAVFSVSQAFAEQGTKSGIYECHVSFMMRLRSPLRDVVNALAPLLYARVAGENGFDTAQVRTALERLWQSYATVRAEVLFGDDQSNDSELNGDHDEQKRGDQSDEHELEHAVAQVSIMEDLDIDGSVGDQSDRITDRYDFSDRDKHTVKLITTMHAFFFALERFAEDAMKLEAPAQAVGTRLPFSSKVARFFRRRVPDKLTMLHAFKFALAMSLASLLVFLKPLRDVFDNGIWASIACAFVWPVGFNHAGGAFHTSLRRLEGTVLAAITSYILMLLCNNNTTAIIACLSAWSLLCIVFRAHAGKWQYAAIVAHFTAPIIMLGTGDGRERALSRIEQNMFGVLVVMTVQLSVPPVRLASTTLVQSLGHVLSVTGEHLFSLASVFLQVSSGHVPGDHVSADHLRQEGDRQHSDTTVSDVAIPIVPTEIAMSDLNVIPESQGRTHVKRALTRTRQLRLQLLRLHQLIGAADDEPAMLRHLFGLPDGFDAEALRNVCAQLLSILRLAHLLGR
ncbi:MAG: hypothetical protein MHM6MM_007487, partial [Cercozoa sp. M6MM]